MNSSTSVKKSNKLQAAVSIGITCIIGWAFTFLATQIFYDYAFGLFIWLPVVLGFTASFIYGFNNHVEKKQLRKISFIALIPFALGMLTFAMEGVICIIMSSPLVLLCSWLGNGIYIKTIYNKKIKKSLNILFTLIGITPLLMAFETGIRIEDDVRAIVTCIEINATRKTVWKNIIEFPELNKPNEFIFKTGIAYPISAKIQGSGVGAIRLCDFSTGSFVEPITVWQEGELLKFNVDQQPEPMREMSFYEIHPNHLHGYWISKKGQFKLTELPNGKILLEGTTWYTNKIKPNFYWTLWSDYIVHKIHERVLEHIKIISEKHHD